MRRKVFYFFFLFSPQNEAGIGGDREGGLMTNVPEGEDKCSRLFSPCPGVSPSKHGFTSFGFPSCVTGLSSQMGSHTAPSNLMGPEAV